MWAGCCPSRLCLSVSLVFRCPLNSFHCYLLSCCLSPPSSFSFNPGCSFCWSIFLLSCTVPLQPLQRLVNVWQGDQPGAEGVLIQALACLLLSWGRGPPVQPQHTQLSVSWGDALALLRPKVWTPTAGGSRIAPPPPPSPPSPSMGLEEDTFSQVIIAFFPFAVMHHLPVQCFLIKVCLVADVNSRSADQI